MKPCIVLVFDEVAGNALGFFGAERRERTDYLILEGFVEAFELSIGLWVVGAGHDMNGVPLGDEGFELPAFQMGSLVGDDARARAGVGFAGFLNDDLRVDLPHGWADVPRRDGARATVEDGAQEVENATDVQIAEVDMPVIVWRKRLDKAGALFRGLAVGAANEPRVFENAVGG
jgi:hypothetical protein